MRFYKIPLCVILGHKLEEKSIVNTINPNNWLKKCSRCGLYVMNGDIGRVTITEGTALKIKMDFEEAFPYSKRKAVQHES